MKVNITFSYYDSDNIMNTYITANVCPFSKANQPWGHLGNMAGGYPITINNIIAPSVENLYQAMRFTHYPNIQQEIINQKSGYGAKLVARKYRNTHTRPDFDDNKILIMLWCLQLKKIQHQNYRNLLLQTDNKDIVEISNKDQFWGAKFNDDKSTLTGHNTLGELHMIIRSEVMNNNMDIIKPNINNFTLINHAL